MFAAHAGVRQADWPLVSGEHWLLPLHAGPVLPGQRGGPEGESQPPPRLVGVCWTALHHVCCLQALQCFQEAAAEVEKEEFLIKLTASEQEEAAASSPRLQYFNKVRTLTGAASVSPAAGDKLCGSTQVLRLLEDVGLPELVLQLASLAITEAASDVNSQVSVFLR